MSEKVKSSIKGNNKKFVPKLMKKIVLAEKPSVGKEIARVLKCHQKKNGYYEGVQNGKIVCFFVICGFCYK